MSVWTLVNHSKMSSRLSKHVKTDSDELTGSLSQFSRSGDSRVALTSVPQTLWLAPIWSLLSYSTQML